MTTLDPQNLTNFTNGYISQGAVSDTQMPLDAVSESQNFDFDKIGSAKVRKGLTLVGDKQANDILGLYEFRDSGSGTDNRLILVTGTTVKYLSAGSWDTKRTVSSGYEAEFATYLDYVFMVNGVDSTMTWNGDIGSSFGTTNSNGAPVGIDIEVFRNRVWIIDANDRIYYSSLPDDTTHLITWDTGSWWIDISPQDGDQGVAVIRDKNSLLVFKHNHIYRVYSIQETEPDPKIFVGTYSKRSIISAKDGVYFHHPTGIYRYTDGSITCISEPVIDIIENITVANYDKVVGWSDGNHIYFSVGNVIMNGITYSNLVLRYTLSSKVWTFRTYPQQFLCASDYNDGTTLFHLVGDDDGNVLKVNVGNTDNGTPIFYSLITRPYSFDGLFSTRKHISQMAVVSDNAQGTKIDVRVDDDDVNAFKTLKQIDNNIAKPFSCDIRGNKIWFRISGTSVGESFVFNGFEILDITSELII